MKRGRLTWKWLAFIFIFDLIVLTLVVSHGANLTRCIVSELYATEKSQRNLDAAPVWALTPDEMKQLNPVSRPQ